MTSVLGFNFGYVTIVYICGKLKGYSEQWRGILNYFSKYRIYSTNLFNFSSTLPKEFHKSKENSLKMTLMPLIHLNLSFSSKNWKNHRCRKISSELTKDIMYLSRIMTLRRVQAARRRVAKLNLLESARKCSNMLE